MSLRVKSEFDSPTLLNNGSHDHLKAVEFLMWKYVFVHFLHVTWHCIAFNELLLKKSAYHKHSNQFPIARQTHQVNARFISYFPSCDTKSCGGWHVLDADPSKSSDARNMQESHMRESRRISIPAGPGAPKTRASQIALQKAALLKVGEESLWDWIICWFKSSFEFFVIHVFLKVSNFLKQSDPKKKYPTLGFYFPTFDKIPNVE